MTDAKRSRYVIIGGGLTAARAVEGIREVDTDGSLRVIGAEEQLPYDRPPLSKAVLKGDDPAESAFLHPQEWYDEHGIELTLGATATALDTSARTVTLDTGEVVGYEKVLIATGSTVRRLSVPGADLMDVLYLRSMPDSSALRARLVPGSQVVVIGGGWIGLEVAAAARERGCEVTVVEPQDAPLAGVVGEEVGRWFADLHRAHGVDLRLGEGVERLEGEGQVSAVVTSSGRSLPADTVVVGVGITPNTALAEEAGIEVDNGVVVDAALRSSTDGVWAAGDVASWYSTTLGRHVRVEHWANALDGGLAAGRSMAGADVTYDPVPFFYSDQYDAGLEYSGNVPRGTDTEVVLRGDPATNEFMAFWVVPEGDGVRVLAGMHVNVWDTMDDVQRLVRERTVVERDRLADADVPLGDLR